MSSYGWLDIYGSQYEAATAAQRGLKAQVLQACAVPGTPVAAVAREFGLNDIPVNAASSPGCI